MRDKQIEEMRHLADEMGKAISTEYEKRVLADERKLEAVLKENGWRKASEVALEVINKALSKIQIMISSIKAQEENGNITEFNGGAKTALEIVFKDIAELKKKYIG